MNVNVNGQTVSTPYGIAENDGSSTTTYLSLYYIDQALQKLDYTATWDGTNKTWSITTNTSPDFSSMTVGTGNTSIEVNGTVVKKVNTIVQPDPQTKSQTTYVPIFYVGEVLQDLGVTETWDGTAHVWSISNEDSSSGTTTQSVKIPKAQVESSNGSSNIAVTGTTPNAVLTLYTSAGTRVLSTSADANGDGTFYNVPAGSYYVTASVGNVESAKSNSVKVDASSTVQTTPSIFASESNGVWYIEVNNTAPGATVTLYDIAGKKLGSTTSNSYGHVTVNDVGAGTYYVIATENGQSYQSNAITIDPASSASLSTPTATVVQTSAEVDISVSNAVPNATVTLYTSAGTVQATATSSSSGYATFTNVPAGKYYAVQTWNGETSGNSNTVTVTVTTPATPSIATTSQNGVASITASNLSPNAVVTLYASTGTVYSTATAGANGTAIFSNVANGTYYVKQTVNGQQSASSNEVTVNTSLAAPVASAQVLNGSWTITVSSVQANAIVTLYTAAGVVEGTSVANANGSATFSNVSPGAYYAKQTANNTQSAASNQVTIAGVVSPTVSLVQGNGVGTITVQGLTPNEVVNLYMSSGTLYATNVASTTSLVFQNVPPGTYYAESVQGSTQSPPSNEVTVSSGPGTSTLLPPTLMVSGSTITAANVPNGMIVTLYRSGGTVYATSSGTASNEVTFSNVPSGSYYAVNSINSSQSGSSNVVTVGATQLQKPVVAAVGLNGTWGINVTNLTAGATVTLLTSTGTIVKEQTAGSDGTTTFSNVPVGTYYVIQSLNGTESQESDSIYV